MAIPSGSGTEVLKRTTINNQSDDATAFRWDGTMATVGTETYTVPANHIITVLSIIICEQGNAAESVNMFMYDGANYDYWDSHRDMTLRDRVLNDNLLSFEAMNSFGKRELETNPHTVWDFDFPNIYPNALD